MFFDEFPWLHTSKSGFLSAFEHFWNNWASRKKGLVVVVCGSSASWMLQNIVNNKGGLHNRITRKIRLLPFTLHETEEFLKSRRINLSRYQVLQLYMAMGGVPHYLKALKPGQSAAQSIDRLCFTKDGALKDEFTNLYRSLFAHAENHIIIKLADEFSLFYLKFMENNRSSGEGTWLRLSARPSWKSWSGSAFEGICLKHIRQVKEALGISGVHSTESPWRYIGNKKEPGVQLDLLIDRDDYCINICEMKFSDAVFTITKGYAENLRQKTALFREKSKTTKTLFLTLITTFGVKKNEHSIGLVQSEIQIDSLFV